MTTRTIGRDLPNGDYVEVTATDHDTTGDYFAVTVSGWERAGTWTGRARKRVGKESNFGGAAHDTALEAAPELAPIVAVHLATADGAPMHAVANGWYFYRGAAAAYEREHYGDAYVERLGTDHDRAARALHVDPADLPTGLDRDGFTAFAAALADAWQAQADAARTALAAMIDGEGVEA
jgi:hypothetical protein